MDSKVERKDKVIHRIYTDYEYVRISKRQFDRILKIYKDVKVSEYYEEWNTWCKLIEKR